MNDAAGLCLVYCLGGGGSRIYMILYDNGYCDHHRPGLNIAYNVDRLCVVIIDIACTLYSALVTASSVSIIKTIVVILVNMEA